MPNIHSVEDLMATFRHEGVAHMGLRELLGKDKFNELCDKTWEQTMDQATRDKWMAYAMKMSEEDYAKLTPEQKQERENQRELRRAAADEFIANMSEDGDYNNVGTWQRIVDWVRNALRRMGINLKVTKDDIRNLLRRAETLEQTEAKDIAEEGNVRFRKVTDKDKIEELEKGNKVKVYRAMQKVNGNYYPPMSGRVKSTVVDKNGKPRTKWEWREPIKLGEWEMSEEHPEMANDDGTFTLDKGNGSKIDAAYNPYIHTSRSPINDQFSSAWNRPELVTVEVEVPESELTSGYRAEKAKDAVGEVEWKSGPVGNALATVGDPRKVILSRYDKPVRHSNFAERIKPSGVECI
jgi:hypothetical protein